MHERAAAKPLNELHITMNKRKYKTSLEVTKYFENCVYISPSKTIHAVCPLSSQRGKCHYAPLVEGIPFALCRVKREESQAFF